MLVNLEIQLHTKICDTVWWQEMRYSLTARDEIQTGGKIWDTNLQWEVGYKIQIDEEMQTGEETQDAHRQQNTSIQFRVMLILESFLFFLTFYIVKFSVFEPICLCKIIYKLCKTNPRQLYNYK